jgi:hypothetical protein
MRRIVANASLIASQSGMLGDHREHVIYVFLHAVQTLFAFTFRSPYSDYIRETLP